MMKITKTETLTGEWVRVEGVLTTNDVDIKIREAEFVERMGEAVGSVTVKLPEALAKNLNEQIPFEYTNNVLRYSGFHEPFGKDDKKDFANYWTSFEARIKAKLRGVRKEETRKERIDKAVSEVRLMLKPKHGWYKGRLAQIVDTFNAGVQRYADEVNERTLRNLQQTLGWFDKWADYIDEKVDVTEEKSEIKAIEDQIAELEAKADEAYAKLRDKRAKAWVEQWDQDKWTWKSEKRGTHRMPDAWIEKTREMVDAGEAFNKKAKHHRALFL